MHREQQKKSEFIERYPSERRRSAFVKKKKVWQWHRLAEIIIIIIILILLLIRIMKQEREFVSVL
jgi:hypothetical protein